ncbi:uncharacterized protein CTRU02_200874 [Colletotrichum truncatum]|uniref:Uncharacterized protein n=1 Tax=Colletotrichum truncatum TaxID=5467 RepID=A0ACC3ZFR5_COLTU|nr:uncharacterized protein CTRU02_00643 [Colletotrichum truncatum]KAF6801894.1 hypothetical protein CTRU02_00643 [Colletotrichum truncatum]
MPAVTHAELAMDGPSSTTRLYHHFSAFHICTGLTILALLVILCLAAHGVSRSKSGNEDINTIERHRQTRDGLDQLVNQQQLHHLFIHDRAWTMDEKSRGISSNTTAAEDRFHGIPGSNVNFVAGHEKESGDYQQTESSEHLPSRGSMFGPGRLSDLTSARFMLARPPPPPPLTPPELSPSVFTYDDRRRSFPGGVSELDASFFEQPNPDYMSSTETATTTATQSVQTTRSSPTPRRRSYTRTLPIGVPASAVGPNFDDAGVAFSPSSYPPTSPYLPGPPPIHGEILEDGTLREVKVHGEIISMLDDSGFGWKRHTRVYGGGVCLACEASGNDGHHGGFYGENVLPEEKRY